MTTAIVLAVLKDGFLMMLQITVIYYKQDVLLEISTENVEIVFLDILQINLEIVTGFHQIVIPSTIMVFVQNAGMDIPLIVHLNYVLYLLANKPKIMMQTLTVERKTKIKNAHHVADTTH